MDFCSLQSKNNIFLIYEENYENFEDKVDQLLNMNNEKYFLNTKNQSNYIINSDDNEETLLRKTILNLV